MNRDLRDEFADLADDMTGTDLAGLRHRVEHTSRRLQTRRTVATSAAAVAVVAVLAGGVALLQFRDDRTTPPVPQNSTTASPPIPSPPVSEAPSVAPSTVDALPGTLYYLTFRPGKPIELRRYIGGQLHTTEFGTASSRDVYASPSPDGTRLVVNTSPDHDAIAPGDLVVVAAGGARRTIAHDVAWSGGSTAVWTPDGTGVIADGVRYDATTGTAGRPATERLEYLTYSPDGSLRAYVAPPDQPSSVKITRADGSAPRIVPVTGLAECDFAGCPTSVQAISDDGRYLALGNVNSDPSHVYTTALVYDTVAKRRLPLTKPVHVWFRPGGAVVVTASEVQIFDRDWHVTHTYPLPDREDAATRLWYRP